MPSCMLKMCARCSWMQEVLAPQKQLWWTAEPTSVCCKAKGLVPEAALAKPGRRSTAQQTQRSTEKQAKGFKKQCEASQGVPKNAEMLFRRPPKWPRNTSSGKFQNCQPTLAWRFQNGNGFWSLIELDRKHVQHPPAGCSAFHSL